MRPSNSTRLHRLSILMGKYGMEPEDYDAGVEEDVRPYFQGDKAVERYVCVTAGAGLDQSHKTFFLLFSDVVAAMTRASEYVRDSIYREYPEEVYDLDEQVSRVPDWAHLQWDVRR